MTRRVVITGMGTVNSLSSDLAGYWERLCAGQSGIGFIEQFDAKNHKVKIAGEVKNFTTEPVVDARAARRMDRFAQFAIVASDSAMRDSGVDMTKEDPYRCGVILGSGIG